MKKSFALILILTLLTGCVYYNTFYNARKSFESAQKRALNAQGKPTSQAVQEYTDVIKKCGKIITNHKKSEWTDDAAFLMAEALYYKQTNNYQALSQFEEIVTNFPNSEFAPKAKLYLIRINRKLRKTEETNTLINNFLINPANTEYYNATHLLAAEFNLEDKEYTKAKYHLERILESDQKSKEYIQAYFLLGKTYYLNKEYQKSTEVFTELLKIKTPQEIKLDTRYFLAYNAFYLEDYATADKIVKLLLHRENRTTQIPWVKLLKGRILLAEGDAESFISSLKFILDNHARTEVSAESAFYLGEYYLYNAFDYAKAIEYYNKVKSEFGKSEFLEASITKSSVASQIQLLSDPTRTLDPESLVNEQFKLAEYFINIMSLPDSALTVYNKIITNKSLLEKQLDTLRVNLDTGRIAFEIEQDSLELAHNAAIVADSLDSMTEEGLSDSLLVETTTIDSTNTAYARTEFEKTADYRSIQTKIESLERILNDYDTKILPFTYYVKSWIYKTLKDNENAAGLIFTALKSEFPQSEYTHACSLMLAGEAPDLTTPEQKVMQKAYDTAVDIMETQPDSALVLLSDFANDTSSSFYTNSLYTIGYINYFVKNDSLAAKSWFDKLLDADAEDKYRANVASFYQDGHFIVAKEVEEEPEAEADKTDDENSELDEEIETGDIDIESANPDSLKEVSPPDTLKKQTPDDTSPKPVIKEQTSE
ncbi:MAG: tetratricopeptide repeat protein [Candidatus Cloacimonetes bacterium]|nr:tetratricopeptide repeat protein [Candidatus Cloacimonadota bacterium]